MTAFATGIINSNVKDDNIASLSLTIETVVTLYVLSRTGNSRNHIVGLEMSPDGGDSWVTVPEVVLGTGSVTANYAATNVRAVVVKPEGEDSTATVFLLAR